MRQLAATPEESGFPAEATPAEAAVGPVPAGIERPRLAGLLSATTDISPKWGISHKWEKKGRTPEF